MNLDELRSVQSKERSKDSLQHLRESFYADVADYVADLRERRDQLAERSDNPFDDPEVNRLTDEIKTAEEVVEAVYERRVGKVVKRASLAAAGMPADEEGLTSEEQKLFTELVERIESNKQEVLDVLAGDETPTDAATATTDEASGTTDAASGTTNATAESVPTPGDSPVPGDGPAPGDGPPSDANDQPASTDASHAPASAGDASTGSDVSAADVMGGEETDTDSTAGTDADGDHARPGSEAAAVAGAGERTGEDAHPPEGESAADEDDSRTDEETDLLGGLDERTTVRVTSDVGEIFGVDERTYDLESEDVVTLPEANAEPLVERGAAEKLD